MNMYGNMLRYTEEKQGRLYDIGEIGNRPGRQNLGDGNVGVKFSFL